MPPAGFELAIPADPRLKRRSHRDRLWKRKYCNKHDGSVTTHKIQLLHAICMFIN